MRLLRILTTGVQEVLASAARVVDKVRVVLTRSDGYIDESFLENAGTWNDVAGDYVTRTTEQTITGAKTFTQPVNLTGQNLGFDRRDGNAVTFLRVDFPELTSAQGRFRLFRGTNTSSWCSFEINNADGAASNQHRLATSGVSSFVCASGGNFGIGTASPLAPFHVQRQSAEDLCALYSYVTSVGTGAVTSFYSAGGTASEPIAKAVGDAIGAFKFYNYRTSGFGSQVGHWLAFARDNNGHASSSFEFRNRDSADGLVTRLAITETGNVGIGTASPEDALTVAGTGSFTGGVKQDLPGRYLMFRNPVGRVTNQASRTGVIVLRMPNTDNAFVNARIVIQRNYHHPIIVEAGGYFRAANENWINTWVRVTQSTGSRTVKKVYFTVDSDFRACIILDSDNAASPWLSDWNSYPSLTVDQLYIGWTAADGDTDWKQVGNYSIYWEDTEAGFNTLTDKFSAERTSASENWHDVWDSNNLPDPARLSGSESFSKGHGKSISDFNAVNGSDDAWNQPSNATLRLKEVNNALAVLVSGESNDRKALIQMGHDSPNFASASFGNALCLQPFSGRVGVGTASPQHKFHVDGVAAAPTIRHLSTDPAWYFQWTTQTIQLPGGGITDSFLQLSNRTGEAIAQFYEGAGTAVFFDGVFANGFFSNNSSWNVQLGVNNGRMRCSGAGNGMIVTSPDGNTTKLIGIDNSGNIEVRDP